MGFGSLESVIISLVVAWIIYMGCLFEWYDKNPLKKILKKMKKVKPLGKVIYMICLIILAPLYEVFALIVFGIWMNVWKLCEKFWKSFCE